MDDKEKRMNVLTDNQNEIITIEQNKKAEVIENLIQNHGNLKKVIEYFDELFEMKEPAVKDVRTTEK